MHPNSRLMFDRYARRYFRADQRVLELGPNGVPSTFARVVDEPGIIWESADVARSVRGASAW